MNNKEIQILKELWNNLMIIQRWDIIEITEEQINTLRKAIVYLETKK